ncbi:REP-associated tyrosine transposase [Paragemmobacter ruber]|uniref:Transposase n=1 Tax=Paragemmobacter ruber TaxID=1985673 RepID=A0ABW9Y0I6_9RHOB|nr:transposase [Rhodobacter ruber]NBE06002.1 transposase [Rhodobacter ruber]
MTSYRRLRISGGSYAFTLCLEERGSTLLLDRIDPLRAAWREAFMAFPATLHAVVILPDHLHVVLTEPEGEVHFSHRWQRLKARFSQGIAERAPPRPSLARKREAGIWQRRFWEHALRDGDAVQQAMAYCRHDPVRHGLVRDAADWPYLTLRDGPARAWPSPPGARVAGPRRMGHPAHGPFGPSP